MRSSVAGATAALVIAIVIAACGAAPGTPSPTPGPATSQPSGPPPSDGAASPTAEVTPTPSPVVGGVGWTSAGTLAGPRPGHTATLLADGGVLVVGGLDEQGAMHLSVERLGRTSAELYDPGRGTWSATGPMSVGRAFHTATRLADGTVLVAGGGIADEVASGTAELYDPVTGRWSVVGSMAAGRLGHMAFLLPDGAVLVIGGNTIGSEPNAVLSAERYDPVAGAWSAVASLGATIYGPGGIALADGRVLVVLGAFNASATTWIYDPSGDTWTESGSMNLPRHGFPVALLPGGGVLAPGGGIGMVDGVLAAAQVFDPATGTWQDTGSMALQRQSFTATALLDGRVMAIGGGGADDAGARSVEIYDPVTGTWALAGSMAEPRFGHTSTLLVDGSVLVVGGYSGAGYAALASAERYLPPPP